MSPALPTGIQIAAELTREIQGKVILVTGVSPGGLGEHFVQTISKHDPGLVILAGRSLTKLQETQTTLERGVNTRLLVLDLSSQEQTRQAAEEVLGYSETCIDVVVNNAGIMAVPYSKTTDGIEMQFGCNHIGHFLFTNLIMSKLGHSNSASRVINVSSNGHRLSPVRFQDYNFQDGASYNRWRAYGQSKTANMLFTTALAKRLHHRGILSFSLHPGVIKTNLSTNLDMASFEELFTIDKQDGHLPPTGGFTYQTLDEGTATHVYAAFHPQLKQSESGGYLEFCKVLAPANVPSWARDVVEADKLWKLSEVLVGQAFSH